MTSPTLRPAEDVAREVLSAGDEAVGLPHCAALIRKDRASALKWAMAILDDQGDCMAAATVDKLAREVEDGKHG